LKTPATHKEESSYSTYLFLLVSLLQLLPYFILKECTHIPVNDTLDVYVPQYKLMGTDAFAFCDYNRPVPQIMNGLNRDLLVSDLNVVTILFLILPAFWAFTVNLLLIKVIAFAGMFLLLKNHFRFLTVFQSSVAAFLFSCIPFFPFFGIGIAGQPLLLYALINIQKKCTDIPTVLILLLFPFYSSLVFTNIFILFFIGAYGLVSWIQQKKFPVRLFTAAVILFALSLQVDYRLIHASSTPGFVPHRVEFDFSAFSKDTGLSGLLKQSLRLLFTGVFHVETFYSVFILALLLLSIQQTNALSKNRILPIFCIILLIALLFGFTHSRFYTPVTDRIHFLKAFQIDRFYTLFPLLYFLLAIFCVQRIFSSPSIRRKRLASLTVVIAGVAVFLYSFPIVSLMRPKDKRGYRLPTYAEYYDSPLMNHVQKAISLPLDQYRIVSVGIDPAVLQYHGFYTLDAYLNIYPLSYKHQFRPVIEKELEKSPALKNYFDLWGNRCYVFSSQIGTQVNTQNAEPSIRAAIRPQLLKNLYEKDIYLLSSKQISNADSLGLQPVAQFNSQYDFRKTVHLYKIRY
jgi:hypothetical protein